MAMVNELRNVKRKRKKQMGPILELNPEQGNRHEAQP